MKNLLILSTLLTLCSCATALIPKDQRKLVFTEETKLSKNDAYVNSLSFIAKNFGNSNEVIKAQDKDSGLLIIKGNTDCNIFKQFGDVNNYLLQFTLELNHKDNKVKMSFEDLFISSSTGEAVGWDYNQLTDKDKINKAGECLSSLKKGLVSNE